MRTRAFGVGLALACVGLVACGGGDDERLTTAELASRGDAVCRKLDTDVKKLASEFDTGIIFPPEQMQTLFTKMVPLVDGAHDSFRALEPPKDLESKYDAALSQLVKDKEKLVAGTKSPEAARKLYDSQVDPFQATNEQLASVGITACSSGGTQGDIGEGGGDGTGPDVTTAPAGTDTTAAEGSTSTSGP